MSWLLPVSFWGECQWSAHRGRSVKHTYGDGVQLYCVNSTVTGFEATGTRIGIHSIFGSNIIYNNITYGSKLGIAAPAGNNDVVGNTIYGPPIPVTDGSNYGGILAGPGNRIKNNLLVDMHPDSGGQGAYIFVTGGSHSSGNELRDGDPTLGGTVVGNVCNNSSAIGCTLTAPGATYFVAPGAANFHNHASSPALTTGTTLGTPFTSDKEGVLRTAPWSSGAYEGTGTLPGPVTQLVFLQPPTSVAQGAVMSPSVTVGLMDATGALVTTATNSVALIIGTSPGGANLTGGAPVAAVGGVASFSALTLSPSGTYTLIAQSSGLPDKPSAAFTVTGAATPARLFMGVQPSDTDSGATMTPPVTVTVRDASSNMIPTSTIPVTIALQQNPAGGTLSCGPATCTKNAVGGTATFDTLSINDRRDWLYAGAH